MHRHHWGRRTFGVAVTVVALTAASACGTDDDTTTETTPVATLPGDGDTATQPDIDPEYVEFCARARELDEQPSMPTMEQFEAYVAAAPAELDEPLAVITAVLEEADGNFMALFSDPEAIEAIDELDAFETEACGLRGDDGPDQDPSVTVVDPAATRVEVEATEYEFDADFPSEPGRYSFVMTNEGEEPHIMILVRLEDDAELDDALATQGEEGVAEEFESELAPPGAEAVLTADLVAGSWVMLCPIPTPDGEPHYELGMINEFTIS
jgi:uncharacterized cupredoxin-like copper-binding protein